MRMVQVHLERLRRHYEASVRSHDEISLLDLSHTLRIWADLKSELPKHAPGFATTSSFKTAIPAPKAVRALRGSGYVIAYMPDGVITFASNGSVMGGPKHHNPEIPRQYSSVVSWSEDGSMKLKNFFVIDKEVDEKTSNVLTQGQLKRCSFLQWMGAEAVRMSYPSQTGELVPLTICRETLIRRVANTLDGSHPSGSADLTNSYDPTVHYLLQFMVGGLSLPYFILLKIAQDILANAPKLLGIPDSGSTTSTTR
jgi:hypothetical protein